MSQESASIARAQHGELLTHQPATANASTGRDDGLPAILAIDPGTMESGWVVLSGRRVVESGVSSNAETLARIAEWPHALAIEMIASYGMPVGREVFETCVWIGRFVQAYRYSALAQLVYRKDVKMHLCGTSQAKDPHIRQALIDLIGPQGVKKAPGPTYGVNSHAWAALGVAATALKLQRERLAPERDA